MLKPAVKIIVQQGLMLADFWDCLRMDPAPVRELRAEFEKHVAQGGQPILIVDLTGVSFAGSTALGGFVGLRKQGARIIFHSVEPTVFEVFRASNLATLFSFADNLEEALKAAGAPASPPSRLPAEAPVQAVANIAPPAARPLPSAPPPLRRRNRALE